MNVCKDQGMRWKKETDLLPFPLVCRRSESERGRCPTHHRRRRSACRCSQRLRPTRICGNGRSRDRRRRGAMRGGGLTKKGAHL